MSRGNVTVIGSGVIGLASAHFLEATGWQVQVLDRGDPKLACSHANCGFIAVSHALPLAEPGPVEETGYAPDPKWTKWASRVGRGFDFEVSDLDRKDEVALLRAGLRLRDVRAAAACAERLSMEDMDAWEAERAVELLLPECYRDESAVSFDDIYDYFGSEEVAAAIGYFAISGRPSVDIAPTSGCCHRLVRPDIIPFLLRVGSSGLLCCPPASIGRR